MPWAETWYWFLYITARAARKRLNHPSESFLPGVLRGHAGRQLGRVWRTGWRSSRCCTHLVVVRPLHDGLS
jgi:hypothetical protein